jgi:arylsulfatase A-like enzyme
MKSPNIIEIICHDLGRHLNCYGWNSVKTPNLNELAVSAISKPTERTYGEPES